MSLPLPPPRDAAAAAAAAAGTAYGAAAGAGSTGSAGDDDVAALAAALARVGVGSPEEAAIRAGREGKAYAAEVRRGLAKALPPALVHPLTAVRSLTREFLSLIHI